LRMGTMMRRKVKKIAALILGFVQNRDLYFGSLYFLR
jgi:hypothetical protein